jgi:hypothetical protein
MIKESGIVEWTPEQFLEFVEGLAGEWRADQIRVTLAERGLVIVAATLIAELQAELDLWHNSSPAESSLYRVRKTAWQPIETAPKDGTHIFVCDQSDPSFSFSQHPPTVAHWFGPPDLPGLRSGGWYLSVSYNEQPRLQGLTHWQHLPAPPAVADTNADAPGNVGLVSGVSADQTSLNITGLDTGVVKTAESCHSPSALNAETE